MTILIVGGGPTGLAAAIELTRLGHKVRIIDKNPGVLEEFKAMGFNARSLDLMEKSGVSQKILANSLHLKKINFFDNNEYYMSIDFSKMKHKHNFMCFIPQCNVEHIMIDRLKEMGVELERNAELLSFTYTPDQVTAKIKTSKGEEENSYQYMLAADGSHSTVREQLKLNFIGKTYKAPWNIADVEMEWDLANDEAYGFVLPENALYLVFPLGKNKYRLGVTGEGVLEKLPVAHKIKKILWQSSFVINVRQIVKYNVGPIYFAGDSSHVHSPAGGRGMNLGIEDAVSFAQKLHKDDLSSYAAIRHEVGKSTIADTERLVFITTNYNILTKFIRTKILANLIKCSKFANSVCSRMSGLKSTDKLT